ncbi:hypothetical protein [Phycicoccus sonneratiae]|uniref:Uncharacterized protein n=1 Tax=Phycicoccus sonneratiae TaxID=2807628 RepID=A0ABS2CR48_9MICO|nr:hypothetical protein [Phycicoccus sonneraticus]MBM6402366.1 hypothetical protein [Phycicoccus sonneraticus]
MNHSPAFLDALAEERAAIALRLGLAPTPEDAAEARGRLRDLDELEARARPDVVGPEGCLG